MTNTLEEWFFIVNPHAGSGKTMSQWIPAEKKLYDMGVKFTVAYTDHKKHATTLAYEAAENGYRKILAVGGDGSVHEAYSGIMRWCDEHGSSPQDFYLGVFPIGSGNDFIKTLRIPHNHAEVCSLIAEEHFVKLDVVRVKSVGGRTGYMANVGGLGFDSHVCKRVNIQKETGKRSKMIYVDALRYTIFHLKPINIEIRCDGEVAYSGEVFSVAMGNGKYSGGCMQQVPSAKYDDGLLDFMVVPKQSVFTILKHIPKLLKGTIEEATESVKFFKCKSLEIIPLDAQSNDIIELDGEIEGRLPMTITMTGEQINVLGG